MLELYLLCLARNICRRQEVFGSGTGHEGSARSIPRGFPRQIGSDFSSVTTATEALANQPTDQSPQEDNSQCRQTGKQESLSHLLFHSLCLVDARPGHALGPVCASMGGGDSGLTVDPSGLYGVTMNGALKPRCSIGSANCSNLIPKIRRRRASFGSIIANTAS